MFTNDKVQIACFTRVICIPLVLYLSNFGGSSGISLTTDFSSVSSGQFGNMVLAIDLAAMKESQMFQFESIDGGLFPEEKEIRVSMVDGSPANIINCRCVQLFHTGVKTDYKRIQRLLVIKSLRMVRKCA